MQRPKFYSKARTIVTIVSVFVLFYSALAQQQQQQQEEDLGDLDQQQQQEDLGDLQALTKSANPIETLFGSGYICLHIDDPKYASSPAFQAFALELAKKYNKTTKYVVGSNETEIYHSGHPSWAPSSETTTTTNTTKRRTTTRVSESVRTSGKKIGEDLKKQSPCTKPGLFPNRKDCNKYFQCVAPVGRETRFRMFNFQCGPGTIFDASIHGCNYPRDVNPKPACWKDVPEPEPELEEEIDPTGQKPVESQAPEAQEPDYGDPDGGQQQLVDDNGDEIGQNHLRPDSTPNPYGWVPTLPTARPRKDRDGELGQQIDDAIDEEISKSHTSPRRTTKKPDGQAPANLEESMATCDGPGSFGYDDDCTKYYTCTLGKGKYDRSEDFSCDPGEIFDVKDEECKPSDQVNPKPNCWSEPDGTGQEPEQTTDPEPPHVPGKGGSKGRGGSGGRTGADDYDVERIYSKDKTSGIEQTSFEEYDLEDSCTKEGIYPHRTNCSKFWKCEPASSRRKRQADLDDDDQTPTRLVRRNFLCEGESIFDGHACRDPARVKPKPKCAKYDRRFAKDSIAVQLRRAGQKVKNDTEIAKRRRGQSGGQQEEEEESTTGEQTDTEDLVDEVTPDRSKGGSKGGQTTHNEEEFDYEEYIDEKGNKKLRRVRRGHADYDYEITEDRFGNRVEKKIPKTNLANGEWEYHTDSKTGKTYRRRVEKTIEYWEEGDGSFEEIVEKNGGKRRIKKRLEADEEWVTINGKKVRRKKSYSNSTTTTTTSSSSSSSSSTKQGSSGAEQTDDDDYDSLDATHSRPNRNRDGIKGERDDDDQGLPTPKPTQECLDQSELIARLRKERETAVRERSLAERQRDHAKTERDTARSELTTMTEERNLVTTERDTARATVQELTTESVKLHTEITALNKTLDKTLKSKQNLLEHLKKLEHTVDSYKKEAVWLKSCCEEKGGADADVEEGVKQSFVKSRRRRSIDSGEILQEKLARRKSKIATAAAAKIFQKRRRDTDNDLDSESPDDIKAYNSPGKFSSKQASEENDPETETELTTLTTTPLPSQISDQISQQQSDSAVDGDGDDAPNSSSANASSDQNFIDASIISTASPAPTSPAAAAAENNSSGSGSSEPSIFAKQLPILIFIFLTLLLFVIICLGCFIIKKLNRMTTLVISPEELETYCRKQGKEQQETVKICDDGRSLLRPSPPTTQGQAKTSSTTAVKATRHTSDSYFSYSDEK